MTMRGAPLPLFLALVLAIGACKRQQQPAPVVAMQPRPNPPTVAAKPPPGDPKERLRQNRWLAQFWEELTPAQRQRVEARMRRAQPPLASDKEGARLAWDGLGLSERDRLVFGAAAARTKGGAEASANAAAATTPPAPESNPAQNPPQ